MSGDERLAALLARYPHSDDGDLPRLDSIALVERSPYDGSYWVTTHPTLDEAARYRTGQEHPEDWHFVLCVALHTGNVYEEEPSVEYRQVVGTFEEIERAHTTTVVDFLREFGPGVS